MSPATRRIIFCLMLCTLASTGLLVPNAVYAQNAFHRIHVGFKAEAPELVFSEYIGGFEYVEYVLPLKLGESIELSLSTDNLSNCFDIYAPGADKPFFAGGEGGNQHRFTAKVDGEFIVKVYLLRLAARDYQSASYTLTMEHGE